MTDPRSENGPRNPTDVQPIVVQRVVEQPPQAKSLAAQIVAVIGKVVGIYFVVAGLVGIVMLVGFFMLMSKLAGS